MEMAPGPSKTNRRHGQEPGFHRERAAAIGRAAAAMALIAGGVEKSGDVLFKPCREAQPGCDKALQSHQQA